MLGWPTHEAQDPPVSASPVGALQALTCHLLIAKTAFSRGGCFTLPDFCEFVPWQYPALDSFCPSAWFGEYSRDESEPDARHHLPRPTALPAARLPADLALPQLSLGCSRTHDPARHSQVLPNSSSLRSLSDKPEASAGPDAFATGNTGILNADWGCSESLGLPWGLAQTSFHRVDNLTPFHR